MDMDGCSFIQFTPPWSTNLGKTRFVDDEH